MRKHKTLALLAVVCGLAGLLTATGQSAAAAPSRVPSATAMPKLHLDKDGHQYVVVEVAVPAAMTGATGVHPNLPPGTWQYLTPGEAWTTYVQGKHLGPNADTFGGRLVIDKYVRHITNGVTWFTASKTITNPTYKTNQTARPVPNGPGMPKSCGWFQDWCYNWKHILDSTASVWGYIWENVALPCLNGATDGYVFTAGNVAASNLLFYTAAVQGTAVRALESSPQGLAWSMIGGCFAGYVKSINGGQPPASRWA